MKKIFLIVCFSTLALFVSAQVGVILSYKNHNPVDWLEKLNADLGDGYSSMRGVGIGLDYWFRLKNKRIEFTPELSYSLFEADAGPNRYRNQLFSFHFNTNIYLFDLGNDCNCPTFSKDGNLLSKGFFIQLSPGVSRFKNDLDTEPKMNDSGLAFEIGAGAGIDIGISDLLTITPIIKYYATPTAKWENFINKENETVDISTSIQQLYLGLKLGFRYKPENRFRRR